MDKSLSSNYLQLDGVRLHYYRTGAGKQPLILAHGVTDDGTCWPRLVEDFSADYDLIMADAPGHGKSGDPQNGYTMRGLVEALAGLARELHLQPPIFLGHSMGAITVLTLAAIYPELPKAILLEDPPPFWLMTHSAVSDQQQVNPLEQWMIANKRKTVQDLTKEAKMNLKWAEVEYESWVNSKHRYSSKTVEMINMPDLVSLGYKELLRQVKCPALLLHADPKLGAILTEKDVDYLKLTIPTLQTAFISGAGHNIRRDEYQAFHQAVDLFLKNIS